VFGRTGAVAAQTGDYSFSQISGTVAATQMPLFTATAEGAVPASGGGTVNFLRADGTWAAPAGGGGGAAPFVYQNAAFTGASLTGYLVDTSTAAFTVNLPATPAVGAWVQLLDAGNSWGTHNVTVNPNGSNLNFSIANMILNTNGAVMLFAFVNATIGWRSFTL
jgi:hypothetical protein